MLVLVLVCTIALVPEIHDCNRSNAVEVIAVRIDAATPSACMLVGQSIIAKMTFGVDRDGEYSRIMCEVKTP